MIKLKKLIALFIFFSAFNGWTQKEYKLGLPVGHSAPIEALDFSPNERFLVSASEDKKAIIWDIKTGKALHILSNHGSDVTSAQFHKSGNYVITTSVDGTVKFWDTYTGKEIDSFDHPGAVKKAIITPDEKYMTCVNYNDRRKLECSVWDLKEQKLLYTIPDVKQMEMSKNGQYLMVHNHYTLKVIDIPSSDVKTTISGYTIISATIDQDGQFVYTGGKIGSLRKWNVSTGQEDLIFSDPDNKEHKRLVREVEKKFKKSLYSYEREMQHTDDIQSISITNAGALLTASSDNTIKLWLTDIALPITRVVSHSPDMWLHQKSFISSADHHTEGVYQSMSAACPYGEGSYYDNILSHGSNKAILWKPFENQIVWNTSTTFTRADLSFYGNYVAMVPETGIIHIYRSTDGALLHELKNNTNTLYSLDIIAPKDELYVASGDNTVSKINIQDWSQSSIFKGHRDFDIFPNRSDLIQKGVRKAIISNNNKLMATLGVDRKMNLWDITNDKKIATTYAYNPHSYIIFSQDDKYIYNFKKTHLSIFDTQDSLKSIEFEIDSLKDYNIGEINNILYAKSSDDELIVSSNLSESIIYNLNLKATSKHFEFSIFEAFQKEKNTFYFGANFGNALIYNTKTRHTDTIYRHNRIIKCSSLSPDEKILIFGSEDNSIVVYDIENSQVKYILKEHINAVTDLQFISERKFISSSKDGALILWNAQTGKPVVKHYIFNQEQHFTLLPSGYYKSTNDAEKNLHYILDSNKVMMFEQFDLKYHRPDLVLKALKHPDKNLIKAYHQAYKKRLKKMGFTEEMLEDDFHLPEIKIKDFEYLPREVEKEHLDINIHLEDSKYPLDRINIWVNDVAIYGKNGISIKEENLQALEKEIRINLARGENKIQVSVLNQVGAESYKETFTVKCSAGKEQPDLYLITIGESEFQQADYNLTYAAKDAQDVANLFAESEVYNKIYSKTLTNEKVTKENVMALQTFLKKAEINDHVMIFIAGHGVLSADLDYYLATYDMDFENPAERGLMYEDLERLLDGIQPLKKTLILDACHSGEIDKEEVALANVENTLIGDIKFRAVGKTVQSKLGTQNTLELTKSLFTDLRKGTGATVISSAGGMEYAMEGSDWNNGLFTYALLHGVKSGEADINNDGEIWLSELKQYVADRVKELSNGKQQPTSRIENQMVDFRVW